MEVQGASRLAIVLVCVLRFLKCYADTPDSYKVSYRAHSSSARSAASESTSMSSSMPEEMYGGFADPGTWIWFLAMNLFAATSINETFPTQGVSYLPRFISSSDLYKLQLCKRSDLFKCVQYGECPSQKVARAIGCPF